eukprot:3054978-Rhodomonas_salina.1
MTTEYFSTTRGTGKFAHESTGSESMADSVPKKRTFRKFQWFPQSQRVGLLGSGMLREFQRGCVEVVVWCGPVLLA